jgi:hypothetical protein
MVQAVHGGNLTEGAEWRRGNQRRGSQSFECARTNREAGMDGSVRQERDGKTRERPATTAASELPHSKAGLQKRSAPGEPGRIRTLNGASVTSTSARAWQRAAE